MQWQNTLSIEQHIRLICKRKMKQINLRGISTTTPTIKITEAHVSQTTIGCTTPQLTTQLLNTPKHLKPNPDECNK